MFSFSNRINVLSSPGGAFRISEARPWFQSTTRFFSVSSVTHAPVKPQNSLQSESKYEENLVRLREMYRTDPEYRQRLADTLQRWKKRQAEADPEWRTKRSFLERENWKERITADPHLTPRRRLRNWITRYPWFRELSWEGYSPVAYPHKEHHYCSSCELTRGNGVKIWWVPERSECLDHREQWVCFGCFVRKKWPNIMPIGYEGITSVRELHARRVELEKSSAQDSAKSEPSPRQMKFEHGGLEEQEESGIVGQASLEKGIVGRGRSSSM